MRGKGSGAWGQQVIATYEETTMSFDPSTLERLLDNAAAENRSSLLEHEVYAALESAGCAVPKFVMIGNGDAPNPDDIAALGCDEVILKVVSPEIAHKTDVGGVVKVKASAQEIARAMGEMLETIPGRYVSWLASHPSLTPAAFKDAVGRRHLRPSTLSAA